MRSPVILVAGSLHRDLMIAAPRLPAVDETVAGQGVTFAFGGKGGNQAVAAARMGARVHFAGAVGDDGLAAGLLAGLDLAGVGRSQVQVIPGASGMSVAITLPGGDYGAVIVSGANLGFDPGRVVFPEGCRALVLQNEVPQAANLALAGRARAAGIAVIWNAAPFREGVVPADVTVVNRGEAAALAGAAAPVAMARAIEARLGGRAVVTLGGEGVATVEGVIPAPKVAVVSTHGAGDMFTGALAARLAAGADLSGALAFAQGAAALHVSLPVEARGGITAAMAAALATGGD